jgi:hypothetical protein
MEGLMPDTSEQINRHELVERLRMGNDFVKGLLDRLEVTKQECANRYLEVHHPQVVPIHHFTNASTECIFLYAEGYFSSTVMVTQALAEGISRFVAERNGIEFNRKLPGPKIVDLLVKKKIVSQDYEEAFKQLWETRNDVHHMNPDVAKIDLPEYAKRSIQNFEVIEREIFAGSWSNDGRLIPTNPKYWDTREDGKVGVFLRLE